MKKLLLLFSLCFLLANTQLRAQVYVLPTIEDDKWERFARSLCLKACYSKYQDDITLTPEKLYTCFKYYSDDYCKEERIRARAREEYEMCLLSCQ